MSNTTHISANQYNKTATITGDRLLSEITVNPPFCIANLAHETVSFTPETLRNMEVIIETARAIWEEAGIEVD